MFPFFVSVVRLLSSCVSFLFNHKSNYKLSIQLIRQFSCLIIIYCLLVTLCFIPGTKSSAIAASRNAIEENQKRHQREQEEAKRANASAPEITNLPNIDETRYSKSSLPLGVDTKPQTYIETAATYISDSADKSQSTSATKIFSYATSSLLLTTPSLSEALSSLSTDLHSSASSDSPLLSSMKTTTKAARTTQSVELVEFAPMPSGYKAPFDFDGDGSSDVGRWRSSNSTNQWASLNLSSYTLGSGSDQIVPADYDGDDTTDYGVFNAGSWAIHKSGGGTISTSWGSSGDVPVPADYDGDGKADLTVWRPSTGVWWILTSSSGYNSYTSVSLGTSSDVTAQGDYDGDGLTDPAVFRPSNGYWYIYKSSTSSVSYIQWGSYADMPVMGDYDGDGKSDCAIYRPSSGQWWALKSSDNNNSWLVATWGNYGDQPVPADYDGDEKTDYAVWRPTTGVWYIIKSSDSGYLYYQIGIAGDVAVPSAYLRKVGAQVAANELAKVRLSPKNRTGGSNLYSRNIYWSTSLAGLPGRSGLDAGLSLSYNSLVWIKQDSNIIFDPDTSNITPGFRFGFPVIEPVYTNKDTNQGAFMLVSPSGARTELRQTAVTNVYESADSSYLQLKIDEAQSPNDPVETLNLTVYTTSGTKMRYVWKAGAYRCSEIKDRNGNYITINHDDEGLLQTITDTLGRVITVNYNELLLPTTITQTWAGTSGTTTHTWATFTYVDKEINTSFDTGLTIYGPPNSTTIKVLSKVTYSDGSNVRFDYNSYGQVKQINNWAADNHQLSYVRYDIDSPSSGQTDCPRFLHSYVKAEKWNLSGGTPQEVTIGYEIEDDEEYEIDGTTEENLRIITITSPDGTINKIYSRMSGWDESLPLLAETYSSDNTTTPKRSVITKYTQDNTGLSYMLNPRVTETKITDGSNTKRTAIGYWTNASPNDSVSIYGLVKYVTEYDQYATSQYRKTYLTYNHASAYVNRRIVGLVSEKDVYDASDNLIAKTTYDYDEGDFEDDDLQQDTQPIRHDHTNYGASFISGRGNLTSVRRWDMSAPTTENLSVRSQIKYNIAGSVVSTLDPLNRETSISYAENFKDTNNSRGTYAYPTQVFDPANTSTTPTAKTEYDFYRGVVTKTEGINGAGNGLGAKVKREYDTNTGRLTKVTTDNNDSYSNNDPYVRYNYPNTGNMVETFTTITDAANNGVDSSDEAYSAVLTDGLGRAIKSFSELPDAPEGIYSTTITEYDVMGRVKRQSVPTETDQYWQPAGDDDRGLDEEDNPLWLWTSYTYDWKGRVLTTTNTDLTVTEASYAGCGCAGGEVVTILGEVLDSGTGQRRKQKIYSDWLGRASKTELYEWDTSTIYSTTATTYDALDRVTLVRQYSGSDSSTTYQDTTFQYDGHGRLWKQHRPEQFTVSGSTTTLTYTTYLYNADDTVDYLFDGRGVKTDYTYNNRGQVTTIDFVLPDPNPTDIPEAAQISFEYDAIGNRTSMEDETGSTSYEYDILSRLTSETREFDDIASSTYEFTYQYTLSGQLKSMTDPSGRVTNYGFDKIGRTKTVTGSGTGSESTYISDINYRAWGANKDATYGSNVEQAYEYNNRLQVSQYEITNAQPLCYNHQLNGCSNLSNTMTWDYTYYADGKPKHVEDSRDNLFNRLYKYDHAGRLKEAYSGQEAEGQTTPTTSPWDPFRLIKSYDVWNNTTTSEGRVWSQGVYAGGTYANNRQIYWPYDAEGNNLYDYSFSHTINAAGQKTKSVSETPIGNGTQQFPYYSPLEIEQKYDGNGQPSVRKQLSRSYNPDSYGNLTTLSEEWQKRYYIRSSVLGGASVLELNKASWENPATPPSIVDRYVYANGARIYKTGMLEFATPNTGSWWQVAPSSQYPIADRQERTPLGGELPSTEPVSIEPYQGNPTWRDEQPLYIEGGDPFDFSGGCTLYGMPTSCSYASSLSNTGAYGAGAIGFGISATGPTGRGALGGGSIIGGTSIWVPDDSQDWWDPLTTTYHIGNGGHLEYVQTGGQTGQKGTKWTGTPDPKAIRNRLEKLLSNPDCADFIKKLLITVSSFQSTIANISYDSPYFSGNLLNLFDEVVKQGGIKRGLPEGIKSTDDNPIKATIGGSIQTRDATIYAGGGYQIGMTLSQGQADRIGAISDAQIVLHELFHLAGSSGGYRDIALARAINLMNNEPAGTGWRDPSAKSSEVTQASAFWDTQLNNHCNDKGKEESQILFPN